MAIRFPEYITTGEQDRTKLELLVNNLPSDTFKSGVDVLATLSPIKGGPVVKLRVHDGNIDDVFKVPDGALVNNQKANNFVDFQYRDQKYLVLQYRA